MIDIQRLGNVIGAWLDYYYAVSDTQKVLAESAIRFPVTAYLERQDHVKVNLEYKHELYTSRRIDIEWENSINSNVLGLMELKYIREDTASKDEKQRVINDLLRLGILPNKDGIDKYFVLCGDKTFFYKIVCKSPTRFKRTTQNLFLPQRRTTKKKKLTTIFDQWLDFNLCDNHYVFCKSFHQSFLKKYAMEYYGDKGFHQMPVGWSFYSRLEYIKLDGKSFVGIWKIDRDKSHL